MAAKVAFLDRVLALYGPEAADARAEFRKVFTDAVRRIWPAEGSGPAQLAPNERMGDAFYLAVHGLSPHNDTQRALKAQAATLMVELGRASVAAASAVDSVHFEAAVDRTGLLARGHLLRLQRNRTAQRHDYARIGCLRVSQSPARFS